MILLRVFLVTLFVLVFIILLFLLICFFLTALDSTKEVKEDGIDEDYIRYKEE